MKKITTLFVLFLFIQSVTSAELLVVPRIDLNAINISGAESKELHKSNSYNTTIVKSQNVFGKFIRKISSLVSKSPTGSKNRSFHWSSIVALCCGCVAFFTGFLGIPAIVFGAIGLAKTGPNKKFKGLGFSIAGLAIGAIGIITFFVLLAAL
jgi:hypothetical protein